MYEASWDKWEFTYVSHMVGFESILKSRKITREKS